MCSPRNTFLLAVMLISEPVLHRIAVNYRDSWINAAAYSYLGWFFYFCQGNSNGLASVDVGAAFTGIR